MTRSKPFPRIFQGGSTVQLRTMRLPSGDTHGVLLVAPEGVLLDGASIDEIVRALQGLKLTLRDHQAARAMPQLLDLDWIPRGMRSDEWLAPEDGTIPSEATHDEIPDEPSPWGRQ